MARQLAVLALVLTLASGCTRTRMAFETMEAPAAEASESDIAAGDRLYPFEGAYGRWGYMDITGRVVLDPAYDAAEPFSEGRAKVRVGDAYGFINPSGTVVVPVRFSSAAAFSQGRALVSEGAERAKRYGFVDPAGNVVVSCDLLLAYSYSEGRALVQFREYRLPWLAQLFKRRAEALTGFLDLDGRVVFELPREAASFSEGLAPFFQPALLSSGRWGYVRPDGSVAIPPTYRGTAYRFNGGLARVVQNEEFTFIDSTGRSAFGSAYSLAHAFSEGRAAVQVGDHWGYIDETGELVIAPRFDQAGSFSEGLAAVEVDGRWGFIGPDGQFAIEPQFDAAQAFDRGLTYVVDDTGTYYIDRSNQPVRPR